MSPEAGFQGVPPDATPFDWSAVVPVVCSTLDQVAALVEVHDGVSCSEIRLEGTSFCVRLGQARRLESIFSPTDVRKFSELERSEIANRNARKWFEESRAAAGVMLRGAHKAQAREAKRKKKTPLHVQEKVAPLWEETLLRRQLAECQAQVAGARRDLAEVQGKLEAANRKLVELETELAEVEEERDKALRDATEWEEQLETMQNAEAEALETFGGLVESLADQLVVDYFRENFRALPLAALEWIVDQERAA